ncbi:MAG: hypothetical protein IPK19_25125 [Chloroflexi bacterium]|nr:hypothetical protein [Chloroflexota bacterium]
MTKAEIIAEFDGFNPPKGRARRLTYRNDQQFAIGIFVSIPEGGVARRLTLQPDTSVEVFGFVSIPKGIALTPDLLGGPLHQLQHQRFNPPKKCPTPDKQTSLSA